MPALLDRRIRQQNLNILGHDFVVDDERELVVLNHGQEAAEVEAAEVEEQAFEGEGGDDVDEVQCDEAG